MTASALSLKAFLKCILLDPSDPVAWKSDSGSRFFVNPESKIWCFRTGHFFYLFINLLFKALDCDREASCSLIMPLSPNSIIWYWSKGGGWCCVAGKETAGLAESNDTTAGFLIKSAPSFGDQSWISGPILD